MQGVSLAGQFNQRTFVTVVAASPSVMSLPC
jgi:hypothetical protein